MTADLRLLPAAVMLWASAALAIGAPEAAMAWALAGWAAAGALTALALASPRHRPWAAIAASAALAAALACTVVAVQAPVRQPMALLEAAESGRFVTTTVVISRAVGESGRYHAVLEGFAVGEEASSARAPVLVFDGAPSGGAGIGTAVRLGGTLTATEPGDDVGFLFFARGEATIVEAAPWFLDWANGLRSRFASTATSLPGDGGGLLPGLAIGDTTAVGEQLDAAMKATALSHLTAVSGANCAVVIGLIMLCGGLLGLSRGWRIAASIAVLAGFVVLVTPEPSVLRAAVMASLVLVALASGRPVRGIPVLSLAVVLLVVADPWLSRSYGFVLSVLATGGLLLLAGPLARRLARWLPTAVAALVAVPLAAQLACQPVLVLLQPSIPVHGVVANLLAAPAAPVATVVGLLACLVSPSAPWLGTLLAQLAWLPSSWIAAVATFFAGLPGNQLPWPGGLPGVALLVLITVGGLLAVVGPGTASLRLAAGAIAVLLAVGYLGSAVGLRVTRQLSMPPGWQLAACDVGQGDAVVVRSAGRTALVDTGPDPGLLTDCLDALGVARIDLLVLSHFDLDHVGGTDAVLGRVDRVIAGPTADAEDDRLIEALASAGAAVEQVGRGADGILGDLRWRVLWPPGPGARPAPVEPGNDASVAMAFAPVGDCAGGCLSSMFLGDLGEQSQTRLLAAEPVPRVDVLKVSHHGSADQSERLYRSARATVGIIGVGAGNGYGHPAPALLALLASTATVPARTDERGLVLLAPDEGGGVVVWSER